ncbi:MAG: CHAT domain-containing protein, partial [Acidobacteriota bacterium]
GAARVAVSLWNINDRITSKFMILFYKKMLSENKKPATALREAQLEIWNQAQWQPPYYWAAFTIHGEFQ